MKELARGLGPHGIRVNALAPGAVPGGGAKNITDEFKSKIPMRRVGTPDDMAATAVAMLSDRFMPYVTGTTIAVDGGLDLYNWIPFPEG
jgi:NAD(P)-dependent dehydrogenase (short-subunit alcohol dehydrogenase family)